MKNIYSKGVHSGKIIFLSLLSSVFWPLTSFSQTAPGIKWQTIMGGNDLDNLLSVRQTSDGGYILGGYTLSYGAGNYDIYLIRTDANGDTLWTKTFGGIGSETGHSVSITMDGGFIITGSTTSFGAGNDIYLVKTDSNGNVTWTKTLSGNIGSIDYSFFAQQTADSGYIITGMTLGFGAGSFDVCLIKTDANGDSLWSKTFGGMFNDQGLSVQQSSDGGYIIAGFTNSFGAGLNDIYLIRTDSIGDTLWTKTFGGTGDETGWSVQQTADSGYIITGTTNSFGADSNDVYLIKTDVNGNMLWTKTLGGPDHDYGFFIQQTADGGYIIGGGTRSFGAGNSDIYLIRTDANGDTLWSKTFGGPANDIGYSIQQTADGGYVVAGYTESFGATDRDFYLIKTDSLGNSGCNEENPPTIVTNPPTQVTSPATIAGSPPIIVTTPAAIVGSGGIVNMICTNVGIYNPQSTIRNPQFSPNPLTTQSKLTFKNNNKEKFLFTLYDITGRVTEGVSTTNNEIILTKGSKPAGVYLFNLKNEKTGERWNGKIMVE